MAIDDSLLDLSEHPERSAEGYLPHGADSSFFDVLAAALFIASAFFLFVEKNIALSGLLFLAFLFAFHPAHAHFRVKQRLRPM